MFYEKELKQFIILNMIYVISQQSEGQRFYVFYCITNLWSRINDIIFILGQHILTTSYFGPMNKINKVGNQNCSYRMGPSCGDVFLARFTKPNNDGQLNHLLQRQKQFVIILWVKKSLLFWRRKQTNRLTTRYGSKLK